jgi:hypothetical protein
MNKKQMYAAMLEHASTAADRTDEGATSKKIIEVWTEIYPEVLPDVKLAERAANVYNKAMARVIKQYS